MDLIIQEKYEADIILAIFFDSVRAPKYDLVVLSRTESLCSIFCNQKRLILHIVFMTIGFIHMIMMLQVRGKGGRKYYSLHSWIGIGIAIAYGLQWFRIFFITFAYCYSQQPNQVINLGVPGTV